MADRERVTPSGLIVAEELTEADKKKKAPAEVRNVVKSPFVPEHKLSVEDRKQRRADNKIMAQRRKLHRRRKKHGR